MGALELGLAMREYIAGENLYCNIPPPIITMGKKKKGRQSSQTSLTGGTASVQTTSTGDIPGPSESPPSRPNQVSTEKGKQPTIRTPAPGKTTAPIDEKLYSRFFGSVLLLHALDPVRGARKGRPKFPDPDDLDSNELLRSFLDSVSYACDRKHGGDTVTAAALQDDPEGPVLLLASNSRIQETTLVTVGEILKDLARFKFGKKSRVKERELENGIVHKLRLLATDRLREYRKRARRLLEDAEHTLRGLGR